MEPVEPFIVVSACLSGIKKRYDGKIVFNPLVNELKAFCKIGVICPETEIGLPVPRERTILYKDQNSGKIRAIYLGTKEDITEKIHHYYEEKKKEFGEVDGFILKAKSPSCSVSSTTKTYKDPEGKILAWYSKGLVGGKILKDFSFLPVVDDVLLREKDKLEEFFIKIFTIRRFRNLKEQFSENKELNLFHEKIKYVLMSFSPNLLEFLEKEIKKGMGIEEYERYFFNICSKNLERGKVINAVLHIFGKISRKLKRGEKRYFLDLLEKYKTGKKSWRFILNELERLFKKYKLFEDRYEIIFNLYPDRLREKFLK